MNTRPTNDSQTSDYTHSQTSRFTRGVTQDAWSNDEKLSTWEGEGGAVTAPRLAPAATARGMTYTPASERRSGLLGAAGIAALSESVPVHRTAPRRESLSLPPPTPRPGSSGTRPPLRRRTGRA